MCIYDQFRAHSNQIHANIDEEFSRIRSPFIIDLNCPVSRKEREHVNV